MGKGKKKTGKIKKPKPRCCGKFKKKSKYCSRCPVILRTQCKLDTEKSEMGKKKAKKKTEKALCKKKACKKKDKKKDKKKK